MSARAHRPYSPERQVTRAAVLCLRAKLPAPFPPNHWPAPHCPTTSRPACLHGDLWCAARNPSHVRSLCLSGNGLGLEHARQLGEWLARADGLELNSLDLSDNAICTSRQSASSAVDTGGLKSLLLPFAHARTSRCVSATCSPSKGLRSPIAGIDTDESRSRELSGSAHRLRRRAGPALIELNLSRNELCAQGSQALAAALRGSRALTCAGTGLRTLSLANCLIGEQGVNSLLPALRQCAALSSLDLTSNFLYDGGCIALCSWLGSAAAKLEHLALACNGISDEGPCRAGQQACIRRSF